MKSMSFMKAGRLLQASLLLISAFALAACGFHPRGSVALPPSLHRIHLKIASGGEFPRMLSRALETSGITVEDDSGNGIAELRVPVAAFGTDALTGGGYVLITEESVHYSVQFDVTGPDGTLLIPLQHINMSREYSYDAVNTIGNASQVQAIEHSLNQDMVLAILFRLRAVAKHELAVPASASSTH
jgi:LPS-assembly lipoprotein